MIAFVLMLVLTGAACSLPSLEGAQEMPTSLPAPELPPVEQPAVPPTGANPSAPAADCTSPVQPGLWTGQIQLYSTVNRMGLRLLEQQSVLPISLQVGCDGMVSGAAARSGEASIRVPLTLNGACSESADYQVTGSVTGSVEAPVLNLDFTTRSGTISCSMESRVSSIPSGQRSTSLDGQTQQVQAQAARASERQLSGDTWPDRLYQEQVPGLETMLVESGLTLERNSSWQLVLQE